MSLLWFKYRLCLCTRTLLGSYPGSKSLVGFPGWEKTIVDLSEIGITIYLGVRGYSAYQRFSSFDVQAFSDFTFSGIFARATGHLSDDVSSCVSPLESKRDLEYYQ